MRSRRISALGLGILVLVIVISAAIVAQPWFQPTAAVPITPLPSPPVYPSIAVQIPRGIPAIHPTHPDVMPAFTQEDVATYVTTNPMPRTFGVSPVTVARIDCTVTSKDVSKLLSGASLGLLNDMPLCYVELQGNFTFSGPTSKQHPQGAAVIFQKGYDVFDAKTGNLMLFGGIP